MNERSYLFILILCGSLLVPAQSICLAWSLGEDMLNVTCRVKDVSHNVSIKDPKGKEQANCHIGGPYPSCVSNWFTRVNSTTKDIELLIKNVHSRQIDGKWTCSQKNHIANTMVSLEKGILGSTEVTLDAETLLVKNGSMTIKLTCRSCWEPRGYYAEFNINERTEESLSYNATSGSCRNEHGICNPDRCSCSLGREFTLIVEKKKSNFTITCDMSFVDRYKSSRFSVIAIVYYDGEAFIHRNPETVVRKEPQKESTTDGTVGGNKDYGENSPEGNTDVFWKVFGVIGIVSMVVHFSVGIFCAIKYRKTIMRKLDEWRGKTYYDNDRNSLKEMENLLGDDATKVSTEDTEKHLEERATKVSIEDTEKHFEERAIESAKEGTQKRSEEQGSLGINDIHGLESPKEGIEKCSEMSRGITNIQKSAKGLNEETEKCWEEQEVDCSKEVIKEPEGQEVECSKVVIKEPEGQGVECSNEVIKEPEGQGAECSKEVIKELEGQGAECSEEVIKELERQGYLKEKTENILESLDYAKICKNTPNSFD